MREREFTDPNGVTWTFIQRPHVRESEALTHVALRIESPWETRVVSCPRAEWEAEQPDLARLLEESLPVGGSRGIDRSSLPGDPPDTPGF
jgi:hypothetical protein